MDKEELIRGVDNFTMRHVRFPKEFYRDALKRYFKSGSCLNAQKYVIDKHGTYVAHSTILEWMLKYKAICLEEGGQHEDFVINFDPNMHPCVNSHFFDAEFMKPIWEEYEESR